MYCSKTDYNNLWAHPFYVGPLHQTMLKVVSRCASVSKISLSSFKVRNHWSSLVPCWIFFLTLRNSLSFLWSTGHQPLMLNTARYMMPTHSQWRQLWQLSPHTGVATNTNVSLERRTLHTLAPQQVSTSPHYHHNTQQRWKGLKKLMLVVMERANRRQAAGARDVFVSRALVCFFFFFFFLLY